jgi:hypothetical protein
MPFIIFYSMLEGKNSRVGSCGKSDASCVKNEAFK